MFIMPADLDAVRAALTGAVDPYHVALEYSTIQHVLLAHTAFAAGGYRAVGWQGEFTDLLEELTVNALIPEGGWNAGDADNPLLKIYTIKSFRLISTSRDLGLHAANREGRQLLIRPNSAVRGILKDEACRKGALELFRAAKSKTDAKRTAKKEEREKFKRFKQAVANHPGHIGHLDAKFRTRLNQGGPAAWAQLYGELGALLREHLPEHHDE